MNKPLSMQAFARARRSQQGGTRIGYGDGKFSAREFDAAKQSELLSYWKTEPTMADYDIFTSLSILQTRARNEFQNNDYVKRFVNLCKQNIVGHEGIRLNPAVRNANGLMDKGANRAIDEAWRKFVKRGNCEVTRQHTITDAQNKAIAGLMVDGELVIRHYTNWSGNKERYGFQFVDPRLLDVTFNKAAQGSGNAVVMGVEKDGFGAPVAYWFRKQLPTRTGISETQEKDLDRVSADDITHIFLPEYVTQTRGVPPIVVCLLRMNMLGGYEEAELVAARIAASKVGILERDAESAGQYEGDDVDEAGNIIIDTEPGGWQELPPGYKANMIDPNHPVEAYESFVKQVLRGIASGMNISYNSLANDLVGVSWSSLRKADLEERDYWRCLQRFVADHLLDAIYEKWLPNALANGTLTINGKSPGPKKADKFGSVLWQPRGWEWVDPAKQQTANKDMISTNQVSVSQLIRESGRDPEVVFEEIAAEKKIMEKLGLTMEDVDQPVTAKPNDDDED